MTKYLAGKCIALGEGRVEFCPDPQQSPGCCLVDLLGPGIDGCYRRDNGDPFDLVLNLGLPAGTDLNLFICTEDAPDKRPPDNAAFLRPSSCNRVSVSHQIERADQHQRFSIGSRVLVSGSCLIECLDECPDIDSLLR